MTNPAPTWTTAADALDARRSGVTFLPRLVPVSGAVRSVGAAGSARVGDRTDVVPRCGPAA